MTTDQLSLDIPQAETLQPKRARPQAFTRNCNECGTEYETRHPASMYCSGRCRQRALRSRHPNEQPKQEQPSQTIPLMNAPQPKPESSVKEVTEEKIDKTEKRNPSIRPKFSNLPPDVAIGVSLLERELNRVEDMYREERGKRKKIQEKYERLKDEVKDERHANQLAGIEAAKPDLVERIMSGFGQLPQPLVESLAPALGRLMDKVVPPSQPGVAGQLQGGEQMDPMTADLIRWIAAQPEQTRELLFHVIGKLMGLDQEKLPATLMQFLNLLQSGSTLSGPQEDQNTATLQPAKPYDERYYSL